jgi:glycosyltransferase involved in cell wall biosynthesis
MGVSLLAIMLNEAPYLDRWWGGINRIVGVFDQIVVVDGGSTDGTPERLRERGVDVRIQPFPGDFSIQRNTGIEDCRNEWVMELDADETMSVPLLAGLHAICQDADRAQMECIGLPRINFLDGTLVASPGAHGLDFQYRLHRRSCHWRGNVHEEITGYRARVELTLADGHFLVHEKDSARHAARNEYYRSLSR